MGFRSLPLGDKFMKCNPSLFGTRPNKNDIVELKIDGTRVLVYYDEKNGVRIYSERGIDVSEKYPEIVEGIQLKYATKEIILDGELCVFDANGKSDFNLMLTRNTTNHLKVNFLRNTTPVVLVVFDILSLNYASTRMNKLSRRKELLNNVVIENTHIQLAKDYGKDAETFDNLIRVIEEKQLEGYVLKDKNSPYLPKRSSYWRKCKFLHEKLVLFDGFEKHKDDNGYTYTNKDGIRVSVNGEGSDYGVKEIEKNGKVLMIVQHLRENPSGLLFQPTHKCFVDEKGGELSERRL